MTLARTVVVRGSGGPEELHVEDRPAPEPGRGQVRIAVRHAGVAYGDLMRRRGVLAPPWAFTPGYDLVGTIDVVGPGVDPQRVGARVAEFRPTTGFGGYTSHALARASGVVDIPDAVPFQDAILLGLNYLTAWHILTRMIAVKHGDAVLVHGAAGGVGTAALDLGQKLGLTLYGTASKGKHELVRRRGATPIDYRSEDFVARMAALEPSGVRGVLDHIGGAHLYRSQQVLAQGGTLVGFGISGDIERGPMAALTGLWPVAHLFLAPNGLRVRTYGIGVPGIHSMAQVRMDWATLMGLRAAGELDPVLGAEVPLDQVREAHDLLERRAVSGKVVLTVP